MFDWTLGWMTGSLVGDLVPWDSGWYRQQRKGWWRKRAQWRAMRVVKLSLAKRLG